MPRVSKPRTAQPPELGLTTDPESSNMARPACEPSEPLRDCAETYESEQSLRILDELRPGVRQELDNDPLSDSEPPVHKGKEPQHPRYSILFDEPADGITLVNNATFETFIEY